LPGQHITQRQEMLYMQSRQSGSTQETSAAKAGISVRSAAGSKPAKQRLKRHGIG